jgi:hypothetical protein
VYGFDGVEVRLEAGRDAGTDLHVGMHAGVFEDGLRRLKSSHAAVEDVEAEMLQGMSAAQRRELATLLFRCAENLEAATKD